MPLNPKDYSTWTSFADHPVFGRTKSDINDWSQNPSLYSELKHYGQFMPEWYVHVDPAPPVDEQQEIANRDIRNLAVACSEIQNVFGPIKYELVILDDYTVFVWVQHPQFAIDIYPNNLPDEDGILTILIDSPDVEQTEYNCPSVDMLTRTLLKVIGT